VNHTPLETRAKDMIPYSAETVKHCYKLLVCSSKLDVVIDFAQSLCGSHEAIRLQLERERDATAAKLTAIADYAEKLLDWGHPAMADDLFKILRS